MYDDNVFPIPSEPPCDDPYAYDEPAPQPWWAPAESWRGSPYLHRNRVTHLVMVDGRLVDTWSEPVERSDYAHVARWLDEQSRPRVTPPPVPPRPSWETALEWLDSLVGGRIALESLDPSDLPAAPDISLEGLPLGSRHRVEALTRALDAVAGEFWDEEVRQALRAAFGLAWSEVPDVVLRARSAAHVAGGLCWVVGRSNGLFGVDGLTQKEVSQQLGLTTTLSACGSSLHHGLRGLQPPQGSRPGTQADLLAVGRPGLLLGTTRRRLIRLRDQALEARDQHLADEARRVLP